LVTLNFEKFFEPRSVAVIGLSDVEAYAILVARILEFGA
jgi:hypothetical protein